MGFEVQARVDGEDWRVGLRCDECNCLVKQERALVIWNGAVQTDWQTKNRHAPAQFACSWRCVDELSEDLPGFKVRSLPYRDFLVLLSGRVSADPLAVACQAITAALRTYDDWATTVQLNNRTSKDVRYGGMWHAALDKLLQDGVIERRIVRHSTSARAKPATEWRVCTRAEHTNGVTALHA